MDCERKNKLVDQNFNYSGKASYEPDVMELVIDSQPAVDPRFTPPPTDYPKQQSFENLGALAKVISSSSPYHAYGWGNPAYGWSNASSQLFYRYLYFYRIV
jgi:hypothetical protein